MDLPVTLQRRITFSSGHRYRRDDLDEAENRRIFGAWTSRFNHGHNYVLWVSASGPVDPVNGMVVNIKRIDDMLKERVIARFDQRSINDEIPEFADRSPSLENLVLFFASTLQDLPEPARLTGLKLEENERLWAEWNPESPMIQLTRTYEFAASHRLHSPTLSAEENVRLYGKCNHVHGHGHNYVLEVTIEGKPDPESGMLADLGDLDAVVEREIMDRYDHRNLDIDVPELQGAPTTSEMVARAIFLRLDGRVPARLARIRLHETARNVFEVCR